MCVSQKERASAPGGNTCATSTSAAARSLAPRPTRDEHFFPIAPATTTALVLCDRDNLSPLKEFRDISSRVLSVAKTGPSRPERRIPTPDRSSQELAHIVHHTSSRRHRRRVATAQQQPSVAVPPSTAARTPPAPPHPKGQHPRRKNQARQKEAFRSTAIITWRAPLHRLHCTYNPGAPSARRSALPYFLDPSVEGRRSSRSCQQSRGDSFKLASSNIVIFDIVHRDMQPSVV